MNLRKYGNFPYNVVVVHGGPGAAGEMKPVAQELSKNFGVIEPFQTKPSLIQQLKELKEVIDTNTTKPVILIGWSWGAWLSYLLTARFPDLVKKLILVNSGPFTELYAQQIMLARLKRLSSRERKNLEKLISSLNKASRKQKNTIFEKVGKILMRSDSYNPLPDKTKIEVNYEIYNKVWNEAEKLRSSGKLLDEAKKIKSPVVAIHGDYDPHPADGVEKPLSAVLKNFHFILLKHCGHTPWLEKEAKQQFYIALRKVLP